MNGIQFLRHAAGALPNSPWVLFTIDIDDNGNVVGSKEITESTGNDIAAASVGVTDGRYYVIGAVFDDHVLVCDSTQH